jgi:hypothetical protein
MGIATNVFHYTSPEGMMGILKSREIFFTNSQFLNDYMKGLILIMSLKLFGAVIIENMIKNFIISCVIV